MKLRCLFCTYSDDEPIFPMVFGSNPIKFLNSHIIGTTDIVDWLSGCKYGFIPYLQNNWTFYFSKERTIRTQMTTD